MPVHISPVSHGINDGPHPLCCLTHRPAPKTRKRARRRSPPRPCPSVAWRWTVLQGFWPCHRRKLLPPSFNNSLNNSPGVANSSTGNISISTPTADSSVEREGLWGIRLPELRLAHWRPQVHFLPAKVCSVARTGSKWHSKENQNSKPAVTSVCFCYCRFGNVSSVGVQFHWIFCLFFFSNCLCTYDWKQ